MSHGNYGNMFYPAKRVSYSIYTAIYRFMPRFLYFMPKTSREVALCATFCAWLVLWYALF